MMHIRPVSDLRNKFPEVEKIAESGEPVFLTKNGYGSMVLLSLEQYSKLTDNGAKEVSTDSVEAPPNGSAEVSKNSLFKGKKKNKNKAAPVNPELQREEEEENLGKHSMLDHAVLPLPPSSNSFRI